MGFGGGGGKATSTTTYASTVPKELMPMFEGMMGEATKNYFLTEPGGDGKQQIMGVRPYTPYSTRPEDYFAGFSPLQQQAQYEAAGMERPIQYQSATYGLTQAGLGGGLSADEALAYGQAGYASGMRGQQFGEQAMRQAQQDAAAAKQAAYGYGQAGYESGMLGQQLGISGGERYGSMGAGYGAQAAGLAPEAQMYGAQAAGLAPEAQMYGRTAADIGAMGLRAETLGRDIGEEARQYARQSAGMGDLYAGLATDPYAVQAYMSPYEDAVIKQQKQSAYRDYDIQMQELKAQAARSGAYGGSRQAIQAAQAARDLNQQLQGIEATGRQAAYDRAIQSMQYGVQTGLSGLSGAQAGLGTALTGGQLGLAGIGQAIAGQQAGLAGLGQAGQLYGQGIAGLGQAGQLYGLGMQGAQVGLQGTQTQLAGTQQGMQGAQMGLSGVDRAIAAGQLGLQGADVGMRGTQQGMQGAQIGLQGVTGAQAGYGLMGQTAAQLADVATAQQASDIARMDMQNKLGTQQQLMEQAKIDQAVKNYEMARGYPMDQLAKYSALLHGYYTPGTTVSEYQNPNVMSQLLGLGTAASQIGSLGGGVARRAGGKIKEAAGIDDLMIRKTLKKVRK